ncbi:MAG: hypothetical protein ACKVG0_11250, partial [Alphaproteobacteria bacterium]
KCQAYCSATVLGALTPPPPAKAAQNNICADVEEVVLEARTPEVDLFDAPSGGTRVLSIAKDDFPTCLPILAQTEARMLKVDIDGTEYWVAPHMVQFRAGHVNPPVCRTLAEGGEDTRTGTTRGLGEGC